jgi:four helix bundle suffix protein
MAISGNLAMLTPIIVRGNVVKKPSDEIYGENGTHDKTAPDNSRDSQSFKEMEIKLTNVTRASLEELLEDYRDFLKVRDLKIWDKNSREARFVRKRGHNSEISYEDYLEFVDTRPAEEVANIGICLVHQTNYLLDQQLKRLEKDFLKDGGLRERMTRARLRERDRQRAEKKRL